jgi:phosphoribosylformylglycinamidine synthase
MQVPAIGGKDSMSGTFMDKHVPPTLAQLCCRASSTVIKLSAASLKQPKSQVVFISCPVLEGGLLDFEALRKNLQAVHKLMQHGKVYKCGSR